MTHLNIQQGSGVEIVSALIIKKLYDIALTVPEPQEGETDAAYMSGNLLVTKASKKRCDYLTDRFHDLHINVTQGYYIDFEDPAVESTLISKGYSSDGVGVTINEANVAAFSSSTFNGNTDIASFKEFGYFILANSNPPANLFNGCSNLADIDLSHITTISNSEFNNTDLSGDLGSSSNGDINMPNVSALNLRAFSNTKIKTISNLGSVTSIPLRCFANCSQLTSVTIPTSVTTLDQGAFSSADLTYTRLFTTISGLSNVTSYGLEAFAQQTSLVIPASDLVAATSIAYCAFDRTKVTGILDLPNLTYLGNGAFRRITTLTLIKCLGKLTSIPNGCFHVNDTDTSSITSVYLPYECTSIEPSAFDLLTALTTIKQYEHSIDDWIEGLTPTYTNISRVTAFGSDCFLGSTSLYLTNADITNATSIGARAFKGTLLTGSLSLPHVVNLGTAAFIRCTGITSIDFTGSTFTSIGNEMFRFCSNLSKIVLPTTVTYLGENWFDGLPATLTLEGFDNISSHSNNNYSITNKTILNPIKTSLVSEKTIISVTNNNNGSYINSLYEPLRTSTFAGYRMSNYIRTTQFCYTSGGNSRMNIGLLYFRDITQFGSRTFWKCDIDNLVIDNVSPPTLNVSQNETDSIWGNEIFPTGNSDVNDNVTIGTLWVPDSAVATYQSNPLYSHLNIKSITSSDLQKYATYAAWKTAEEEAVAQGGHAPVGLIEAWRT